MPNLYSTASRVLFMTVVLSCNFAVATENNNVIEAVGPSGRASVASTSPSVDSTGVDSPSSESAYTPKHTREATQPRQSAAPAAPATSSTSSFSPRRLRLSGATAPSGTEHPSSTRSNDLLGGLADSSAVTAIAALAFVAGLFLLFAWFVKRGMPASSQVVPSEAVRILGRVPLGARQFGNLLQLGGKLVLVHVSPNGVEKIAEIENPQEVERMIALCSKNSSGSSQREFDEVFGKFAAEQTSQGFLGTEASSLSGGGRNA